MSELPEEGGYELLTDKWGNGTCDVCREMIPSNETFVYIDSLQNYGGTCTCYKCIKKIYKELEPDFKCRLCGVEMTGDTPELENCGGDCRRCIEAIENETL